MCNKRHQRTPTLACIAGAQGKIFCCQPSRLIDQTEEGWILEPWKQYQSPPLQGERERNTGKEIKQTCGPLGSVEWAHHVQTWWRGERGKESVGEKCREKLRQAALVWTSTAHALHPSSVSSLLPCSSSRTAQHFNSIFPPWEMK